MIRYYKAQAVCKVCGITPRCLDYWITTEVVAPSKVLETEKRRIFLFSFEDMARVKLMKSLRQTGISLQKIRAALKHLRGVRFDQNLAAGKWLLTDGNALFTVTTNPSALETLVGDSKGQLAFSVVALGETGSEVQNILDTKNIKDVLPGRFKGQLKNWKDVGIG